MYADCAEGPVPEYASDPLVCPSSRSHLSYFCFSSLIFSLPSNSFIIFYFYFYFDKSVQEASKLWELSMKMVGL